MSGRAHPERRSRGVVDRVDRPIADEMRSGLLGGWGEGGEEGLLAPSIPRHDGRRGSIRIGMRQSGEDFLRALQLRNRSAARPRLSRRESGCVRFKVQTSRDAASMGARRRWCRAIHVFGGPRFPGGSCLWHVRRLGAISEGLGAGPRLSADGSVQKHLGHPDRRAWRTRDATRNQARLR